MIGKVAVVTGANQGIGFGIIKLLCKRGVKTVYLTARDEKRGTEAVKTLNSKGLFPVFHQLDITNEESIKKFEYFIKNRHRCIDILVNNAAVACKTFSEVTYDDAKNVINVNFNSILTMEKYIYPLLNDNARVINISSDSGHLSKLKNKYWIERLSREDLQLNDINDFTSWFLDSIKNNTFKKEDFTWNFLYSYVVAKIAVSAYTRVQQRNIGRGICVNSLHPGFVKTSMTKGTGLLTIEEAAEAPVYLALDADTSIRGKYIWYDKAEVDWADTSLVLNYVDEHTMKEFLQKIS
ncbi:carbonyl reductase [NADPH] 3-like [Pieris brassicae]|uniref:carbonyl reductase [NADPH] 3-like n=1 Tax=Pieris brassicae TaxID=7116 RepID=UPI001E6613DB|nr:carbonyl reductase [NADPH] 3-like [Pieris brassicae]